MGVLRYHPKNIGDVHLCLRGVEDNVVVECGTDLKLEDVILSLTCVLCGSGRLGCGCLLIKSRLG
jgi:hypothetical protein